MAKISTKTQFLRGTLSLGCMFTACAVGGAIFLGLESIPGLLLAAVAIAPAPIAFLAIELLCPALPYLKHTTYFVYLGIWLLVFFYYFLTATELPQVALIAISFLIVAGIAGYLPLFVRWPSNEYHLQGD